jgi:PhzF family phenazine biosynthesis protein
MATSRPLFVVDAFTNEPFRGNPAAVCLLDDGPAPDAAWMRSVAAEMRHSETAFARPRTGPAAVAGDWDLRWFTPEVEVDLCGHATLATAHVLWTEGAADPDGGPLRFQTRSGTLSARASGGRVELDFPALAGVVVDDRSEPGLRHAVAAALGVRAVAVERNVHDLLAEVDGAHTVRALAPDLDAVRALDTRALVVTASSDDPAFDFVSRCFAPRVGVPEDPVTGSAHCALAPYWAERIGRLDLVGRQASPRGGVVHCRVVPGIGGDDDRVRLAGTAVTVTRGTLLA